MNNYHDYDTNSYILKYALSKYDHSFAIKHAFNWKNQDLKIADFANSSYNFHLRLKLTAFEFKTFDNISLAF